jgi:hypothetical protein
MPIPICCLASKPSCAQTKQHMKRFLVLVLVTVVTGVASAQPRWWKGNLHTHTFWSDGDDFPEMVTEWYKTNGYHFLGLSDHNVFQDTRVSRNQDDKRVQRALPRYIERFGQDWVDLGETNGKPIVWLKTFREFRPLFDEPGRFLLIRSEEITDSAPPKIPVHMIGSNLREFVKPRGGSNVVEVMQNNMDAVREQRERTGVPMLAHIAHPNFHYAITAEEMVQVRGDRFFEVYNGHADVRNNGDALHASTERMWDILNTQKLAERGEALMYGIGTDDSHHYHVYSPSNSNSGRGWIQVRAERLTAESIIGALERGDFYASTGVTLRDIQVKSDRLTLQIEPQRGVTYTTQFIGTRSGYDRSSTPVLGTNGQPLRITRVYSKDVGAVLAEVRGTKPSYKFKGNELYVRAKVISSRVKPNGVFPDEREVAWTQPIIPVPR